MSILLCKLSNCTRTSIQLFIRLDLAWEGEIRCHHDPNKSILVNFLLTQQAYAQQAQDIKAKTTIDNDDWLSLHCALKDNAPLGSIKLLVGALRIAGHIQSFPLDISNIACEFSSVKVVRYLIELDNIMEEDLASMHLEFTRHVVEVTWKLSNTFWMNILL